MTGAQQAEVAEPADALRSGRSEGNLVGVQISPSAPAHVDNRGRGWARMVAGASASEESPSCTERGCPVKAGEAPRGVDSPDRRAKRFAREQQRPNRRVTAGVKRAILPAAISESAASRLLAEAGSREPPRRRRRGRSLVGPREMTIGNRTRLTLPPHSSPSWCL